MREMLISLKKDKYKLLYVEDNSTTRFFTSMFLQPYFKTIIEAKSGREALTLYMSEKPDIIITDIEMPELNGLELCREIRKDNLQLPILITTAYTSVEYLLEAVELNLVKYLSKPLDEEKISKALELCFERIELNTPSIVQLDRELFFDMFNQTLIKENRIIPISSSETLLLEILIKNSQRIVVYEEIENFIWRDTYMSKDALRSLVKKLRGHIGKELIENISKTGYKIKLYG